MDGVEGLKDDFLLALRRHERDRPGTDERHEHFLGPVAVEGGAVARVALDHAEVEPVRGQRDVRRQVGKVGALGDAAADEVDFPAAASRKAAVDEGFLGAAQLGEARDALHHGLERRAARPGHRFVAVHGYYGLMFASLTIAAHLTSSLLM